MDKVPNEPGGWELEWMRCCGDDAVPGRRIGHVDYGRKWSSTETDIQAIGRLSPRESYDRAFRMRTAFQQSVLHRELPKKQWTTSEQVS